MLLTFPFKVFYNLLRFFLRTTTKKHLIIIRDHATNRTQAVFSFAHRVASPAVVHPVAIPPVAVHERRLCRRRCLSQNRPKAAAALRDLILYWVSEEADTRPKRPPLCPAVQWVLSLQAGWSTSNPNRHAPQEKTLCPDCR